MPEQPQVDTQVSPEVHPQVAATLISDHVPETDMIVTATTAALEATLKTLGSIVSPRTELDSLSAKGLRPTNFADRGSSHGLRMVAGKATVTTPHQQLYDAGLRAIEEASAKMDHQYGRLREAEGKLEQGITDSLRDLRYGAQVATETRAMLRTETDSQKRFGMVTEAARRGDLAMVAAVLSAPAYLSGLTDEQQQLVRETAAHAVAPALKARRDAARKAMAILRRAGGHLTTELATLQRYQSTGAARVSAAIAAIGNRDG